MRLSETVIGNKYVIVKINTCGNSLYALWDLGITEGSEIERVGHSPFKDPSAYLIKDTVLAIRNELAELIEVMTK